MVAFFHWINSQMLNLVIYNKHVGESEGGGRDTRRRYITSSVVTFTPVGHRDTMQLHFHTTGQQARQQSDLNIYNQGHWCSVMKR